LQKIQVYYFPPKSFFAEFKKLKCFFAVVGLAQTNTPKLPATTTMSSIAINQTVSAAVLKMITSNTEDIVGRLAEKYGFDLEEALHLTLPKEVVKKEVTPRKSSPKASPKAETKSVKGKGKAKEEKEAKAKKAKTGYLLFSDSVRAEVREALEEDAEEGVKVMAKDVVRGIAAKWKELSEEEQGEWKDQAAAAKSASASEAEEEEEE